MELPTNVSEQVLYNSGYRGIAKRSCNKNKPVVIKNADFSIFPPDMFTVIAITVCHLAYYITCNTLMMLIKSVILVSKI